MKTFYWILGIIVVAAVLWAGTAIVLANLMNYQIAIWLYTTLPLYSGGAAALLIFLSAAANAVKNRGKGNGRIETLGLTKRG